MSECVKPSNVIVLEKKTTEKTRLHTIHRNEKKIMGCKHSCSIHRSKLICYRMLYIGNNFEAIRIFFAALSGKTNTQLQFGWNVRMNFNVFTIYGYSVKYSTCKGPRLRCIWMCRRQNIQYE